VGTIPLELQIAAPEPEKLADYRERIRGYMFKAVHEAKRNLSWVNPDPEYVAALEQFIEAILSSPARKGRSGFWQDLARFLPAITYFGCINSLAQLLLKIGSPGVPDIYRGNEIWDFSLVDPDNRRPADFDHCRHLLAQLQDRAASGEYHELCAELLENWQDGRVKMWTTLRGLAFRREHAELFRKGSYLPLEPTGSKREHVISFARREEQHDETIIVAVPRFSYTLMKGQPAAPLGDVWEETTIQLPRATPKHFLNIFTGAIIEAGNAGTILCREVFRNFPVALLLGR
jgi:(1->4)-alpha-D-glucan 1-alpha-D-glucosylmutase